MSRIVAVALALLCLGSPARAETGSCAARQTVLDYLTREHQESPVAMGRANNGGVVEVLTNPGGSTWTILITLPDGRTCMIAAGEAWRSLTTTAARAAEPGA